MIWHLTKPDLHWHRLWQPSLQLYKTCTVLFLLLLLLYHDHVVIKCIHRRNTDKSHAQWSQTTSGQSYLAKAASNPWGKSEIGTARLTFLGTSWVSTPDRTLDPFTALSRVCTAKPRDRLTDARIIDLNSPHLMHYSSTRPKMRIQLTMRIVTHRQWPQRISTQTRVGPDAPAVYALTFHYMYWQAFIQQTTTMYSYMPAGYTESYYHCTTARPSDLTFPAIASRSLPAKAIDTVPRNGSTLAIE